MVVSYRFGAYPISSEMYSESIIALRPERAITIVSTRFNNGLYQRIQDQGWGPQLLVRHNRNISLAKPITITSTVDRLAVNPQMKLGLDDQVCVSPIKRILIYDVSDCANQYYLPADGFSLHDAHPCGYGYDSAPQPLISLITPEYEPPAFDYSNGLCYIPPRRASIAYGHRVGRYYWGR
eukprot:6175726-Pleurochrysis_carterae.AAC.1